MTKLGGHTMNGMPGIQANAQVALAKTPTRASGALSGEGSGIPQQTEAWTPSAADPGVATPRPSINGDLLVRLTAHALETTMVASACGLAMMPQLGGQMSINQESGVFSSQTPGFMGGSITKFSLPGGTEVWRDVSPTSFKSGSPLQETFRAYAATPLMMMMDPKTVTTRVPLPVTVNPDRTVQVTNPDGTLTILDPEAMTVQQRPAQ